MKRAELYLFCDVLEIQAWLQTLLVEFNGVIADFALWKPAKIITSSDAILRLGDLDGRLVLYFGEVEIAGSDSEFLIADGPYGCVDRLSIYAQFNTRHKTPYCIRAYMNDGSAGSCMISSLMRLIKRDTKTGMRLIEQKESFPWKIGRYSEGAVALQKAGTKFLWSEDSRQTIKFGLDDQSVWTRKTGQ
jgi:hypothetical protein